MSSEIHCVFCNKKGTVSDKDLDRFLSSREVINFLKSEAQMLTLTLLTSKGNVISLLASIKRSAPDVAKIIINAIVPKNCGCRKKIDSTLDIMSSGEEENISENNEFTIH